MFWNTLPDITTVLNVITITICPASGAMVELGFSLMNLIINNLQSSINIKTLDATMHIHYNGPDLSDKEADKNYWCMEQKNKQEELNCEFIWIDIWHKIYRLCI